MKKLLLSLLLALPFVAYAESEESGEFVLEADRACHACRGSPALRLSDFHGNYRAFSSSAGGVAGTTTTGYSNTSVSQFSISRAGLGTVHFLSSSTYTGPIGTPLTVISSNSVTPFPVINFTLTITDEDHGAGIVAFADYPFPGSDLVGDYVATKRRGEVESFIVNVTGYAGTTPAQVANAFLIFAERQ